MTAGDFLIPVCINTECDVVQLMCVVLQCEQKNVDKWRHADSRKSQRGNNCDTTTKGAAGQTEHDVHCQTGSGILLFACVIPAWTQRGMISHLNSSIPVFFSCIPFVPYLLPPFIPCFCLIYFAYQSPGPSSRPAVISYLHFNSHIQSPCITPVNWMHYIYFFKIIHKFITNRNTHTLYEVKIHHHTKPRCHIS